MKVRTTPSPAAGGHALVLCLMVGSITGFTLLSYLAMVNNQNRSIARSQGWNYAIAVAEAGLEEALTHLYHHANDWDEDGWTLSNGAYVKRRALGGAEYWVGISNINPPVIYAQGYVRIPDSTNSIPPRTVRVTTMRNGMFRKGMVAKGYIDMSGNNIRTDSFDSTDPAYSTNGRYDPAKARDNGDVATNLTVTNSLNVGNADLYGHVSTGPGGTVSIGPNGAVGSKAWHDAGNQGIQPGWFTDDMNVSFPDVKPPFTAAPAPLGGRLCGTNYTYVLLNGNYMLSSLNISGHSKVVVTGKAKLYVTGNVSLSGQSYIYIAPNASLELYVGGSSASLAGNGVLNPNANALSFAYYGLPSNTSLSLSGNAAFTGVVYAPSAAFTLGGGGSTTYDFVGASVTGSVRLNGHFNFHYDENLGRVGPSIGFVITSWNEI
ncbi:MAG: hypothetical protein FJ387_09440 [Verrucomicrobia bacterium]|nr:hypothetical protein [Verrucomicrobiota bacterium]